MKSTKSRKLLVVAIVLATLALAVLSAVVLADVAYADWITIQRQVRVGDSYAALDARYHVPAGTISGLNGGARLVPGTWITVPVEAVAPAHQPSPRKRTGQPRFPGYPSGYRPSAWR